MASNNQEFARKALLRRVSGAARQAEPPARCRVAGRPRSGPGQPSADGVSQLHGFNKISLATR